MTSRLCLSPLQVPPPPPVRVVCVRVRDQVGKGQLGTSSEKSLIHGPIISQVGQWKSGPGRGLGSASAPAAQPCTQTPQHHAGGGGAGTPSRGSEPAPSTEGLLALQTGVGLSISART